jgi:hypothetical protein
MKDVDVWIEVDKLDNSEFTHFVDSVMGSFRLHEQLHHVHLLRTPHRAH